jgi:hypothetical protein
MQKSWFHEGPIFNILKLRHLYVKDVLSTSRSLATYCVTNLDLALLNVG